MSGKRKVELRRSARNAGIKNEERKDDGPAAKRSRKNDAGEHKQKTKQSTKVSEKTMPVKKNAKTVRQTGKEDSKIHRQSAVGETSVNTETPKNTLLGLPEDLHRLIVPLLGFRDRANYAATCKSLYAIEAKVEKAFHPEQWETFTIHNTEGITLTQKYHLPSDDKDIDPWRWRTIYLTPTTAVDLNPVIRRIVQALKFEKFTAKVDLTDPTQISYLSHLSSGSVFCMDIFHLGKTPGSIDSGLIDVLPWNIPTGDAEDTYINLYNVQVVPNKMKQLYECARNSSFLSHRFHIQDVSVFGSKVMGVKNFTLEKYKKNTTVKTTASMKTTNNDAEVYYTDHNPIRFLMMEGNCETRVKKTYAELLEIEMKKNPYCSSVNSPAYKRIPAAAK